MSFSTKLLVAATLLASACATAPAKPQAAAQAPGQEPTLLTDSKGNKYKVVCHMERPTGSNIAEKVCRPEMLDDTAIQQFQDQLKNNHTQQYLRGG